MAFDSVKYHQPVDAGDVGFHAFLSGHALLAITEAIAKIAEKAQVDVSQEIDIVRTHIKKFGEEFSEMTGWTPE